MYRMVFQCKNQCPQRSELWNKIEAHQIQSKCHMIGGTTERPTKLSTDGSLSLPPVSQGHHGMLQHPRLLSCYHVASQPSPSKRICFDRDKCNLECNMTMCWSPDSESASGKTISSMMSETLQWRKAESWLCSMQKIPDEKKKVIIQTISSIWIVSVQSYRLPL